MYIRLEIRDIRPLGYENVYLPLYKVAVTPFHIQGVDMMIIIAPTEKMCTHRKTGQNKECGTMPENTGCTINIGFSLDHHRRR